MAAEYLLDIGDEFTQVINHIASAGQAVQIDQLEVKVDSRLQFAMHKKISSVEITVHHCVRKCIQLVRHIYQSSQEIDRLAITIICSINATLEGVNDIQ